MEQCLRPGIEPSYLLYAWIKFYSDDFISNFGCLDGCISQACSRVQNASHDRRNGCNLPQGILHRINVFDAMHHEACNEHARRSPCRHQATYTVCVFREYLYRSDIVIFENEAVNFGFADLLYAMPIDVFAFRKCDTFGSESHNYR